MTAITPSLIPTSRRAEAPQPIEDQAVFDNQVEHKLFTTAFGASAARDRIPGETRRSRADARFVNPAFDRRDDGVIEDAGADMDI